MSNWKEKTDTFWKEKLSPLQFKVTRKKGTERAFSGGTWDNKESGIYNCICCGSKLFLSESKFDSGTGWPSFYAPASEDNLRLADDRSLFLRKRTEVLCKQCDAHLGHVFDDGPEPTGKRYCMNSAAMTFKKNESE